MCTNNQSNYFILHSSFADTMCSLQSYFEAILHEVTVHFAAQGQRAEMSDFCHSIVFGMMNIVNTLLQLPLCSLLDDPVVIGIWIGSEQATQSETPSGLP